MPNLITQLAEALPEGTEVPGWTCSRGVWEWDVPRLLEAGYAESSAVLLSESSEPIDLAAFTYAAEGVLYERAAYIHMHSHTCWYVWQYWDHPELLVANAPSRPAAALAALRAMKEGA